jgi:ABC-type amino acid transport substrate-binding protein
MKRNILIALLAIALIATGFTFMKSGNREDQIRIGMSGSYKPYTFVDEKGDLTGFDVEVWNEIGKRINKDVAFVTSDFSGLFGMLDVGQIDTIANQITVTEARKEKYLFSNPYVYYGAQLITNSDRDDITDLESLKGKKVAVSLGSNYEEMLRAFDTTGEIEIVTYDSGPSAYQDVALGRVDAALNDRLALLSVIGESGLPLKLAGQPIQEMHNAFPFLMGDTEQSLIVLINDAIDAMYDDGTMKAISMKYFDVDITERFSQ